MFKIPLVQLKEKILATEKISTEELEERIKNKINELSGLISEEGAAHIIANELGVELTPKENADLKIKEIYAGMRNVSCSGKVVRKFEVREFSKGEKSGKVCSLILGDETATIRVVFWNEQVDLLNKVEEGTILKVMDSYVRENNNNREIHLGQKGSIELNPEGVSIGEVRQTTSFGRKTIQELQGGETSVEIMGTVVQVFDPRYFNIDPETRKRVQEGGELSYVMNAVLDDGTGTIRAVFWKNQTNRFLDMDEEKLGGFKEDVGAFEDVKTDLLGEQFKLMGKVVKNEMFDRLEFSVQMVEKAKASEELERVK